MNWVFTKVGLGKRLGKFRYQKLVKSWYSEYFLSWVQLGFIS